MKKFIENFVGKNYVSDKYLDLLAYSYDSSQMEAIPGLVVWPENSDQIQKIISFCAKRKLPVVPRGEGTNLVGATVLRNSIVLHTSRISSIFYLNQEEGWVDVGAGLRMGDLEEFVNSKGLEFPVKPLYFGNHTVGGVCAINYAGRRSLACGRVSDWVIDADIVDGRGKFFTTKDTDFFCGTEGTTGIITRVKLKLSQKVIGGSISIKQFKELTALFSYFDRIQKNKAILSIEYFNPLLSDLAGLEGSHTLFIEYSNLKSGDINLVADMRKVWGPYKNAHNTARQNHYFFMEDFTVKGSSMFDFFEWCLEHSIPLQASMVLGIVHPYFKADQRNLMVQCYDKVISLKGLIAGGFGYGRLKKGGLDKELRKKMVLIKEKADYNNIINPGCMIDYK